MTEILTVLRREFIYIWYYFEVQFRQIFRYWIIGMLTGSLISVFAKERIHGAFAGIGIKSGAFSALFRPVFWASHPLFVCTARSRLPRPSGNRA